MHEVRTNAIAHGTATVFTCERLGEECEQTTCPDGGRGFRKEVIRRPVDVTNGADELDNTPTELSGDRWVQAPLDTRVWDRRRATSGLPGRHPGPTSRSQQTFAPRSRPLSVDLPPEE